MASANPLYIPLCEYDDARGRRTLKAVIDDLARPAPSPVAVAVTLIPTSTGTATALGWSSPRSRGGSTAFAVRVPIPTGSLVHRTAEVERAASVAEINGGVAERASSGALAGILAYSEEPIVSADIVDERLLAPVPAAA